MKKNNISPILVLIFVSLLTKLFVYILPIFVPHTGLDSFDHQYFFESAQQLLGGVYPPGFSYPPLALVPMVVSYILSFGNFGIFTVVFQLLMAICDITVIICIYMIGLKFLTRHQAFIAALIYAISISVAYFSLTKFDSFPAGLLMLAIYFTVCNESYKGCFTSVVGFFIKIYSIVALPFLYFYNIKKVNLSIYIAIGICSFVTIAFFRDVIASNLIRANTYVNTPGNVISSIIGINVSWAMYTLLGIVLIFIFGYSLCREKNDVRGLFVAIGVAIFAVVFCMQYHSPQYFMWYAPIFCLLVADSVYGILIFCTVSTMVYFEFPVLYGVLYENGQFVTPGVAWFFVLEWAVMFLMVHLVTRRRIFISKENQTH